MNRDVQMIIDHELETLKQLPPLAGLPESLLALVLQDSRLVFYPRGAHLAHPDLGSDLSTLFIVKQGRIALHMPDSHGLMGLAALRAEHPGVAVAMISAHDDPATIRRALAYGACAFIPKRSDVAQLRHALHTVLIDCEDSVPDALRDAVAANAPSAEDRDTAARLASLTPQQFKVLVLVSEGQLNKQIADVLGISIKTVEVHRARVMEKMAAQSLAELVQNVMAIEGGRQL